MPVTGGGGWQAVAYTIRTARKVGFLRLYRAMRTRNACKTCALGMGGQQGGMRNERGHFPEFCKKSLQAMASDMQGRIEERFFQQYSIAQMKGFSPREMEMMGRLTTPLHATAGDTHYRPVSWEQALSVVVNKLKGTDPNNTFFYSSGRSSNEAGFLLQLFARVYGTNHVNNCSYYCHQASGVGLGESLGTGTATISLDDVESCDTFFLIGGNPASNHPRLMTSLMKLRRRGGQVIVINPIKEPGLVNFRVPSDPRSMLMGSEIASIYLQPTIGGDIALLSGIAKALLESHPQSLANEFLTSATEGFERVQDHLRQLNWEQIESACGVSRAKIEQAAAAYARSEKSIFAWTMGITHHEHGVQNVQWIVNLALLRGMVGKSGAGVLPIRGHSNVQGLGSVAVTPALKSAVLERLESLGIHAPTTLGHDTMACMEAAHRGDVRFALCLGGNLFGSNPDAAFASDAISNIDLVVYLSTTLNTGHASGVGKETLILPVLARDEEPEPTTQESMFNFVRLSDGGAARHAGPRSEVSILADIGQGVLDSSSPIDWTLAHRHDHLRSLIARIIPGFEQLESIAQTKREFHIPGRVFHQPVFPTPTGKAKLIAHAIPDLPDLSGNQLRLMTIRSEGQFNTVVYEEHDLYRKQVRRDVILMNPSDMQRLNLREDQPITITSDAGVMKNILARPFDIAAGCCAMYLPEANILVSRAVDPRSRTPAFKSVVVTVSPSRTLNVVAAPAL